MFLELNLCDDVNRFHYIPFVGSKNISFRFGKMKNETTSKNVLRIMMTTLSFLHLHLLLLPTIQLLFSSLTSLTLQLCWELKQVYSQTSRLTGVWWSENRESENAKVQKVFAFDKLQRDSKTILLSSERHH